MTIKPFMQMVKLLDKEQIVRLLQEMRYCDIVISQTAENIIAKQWYKMLKQGKDKEESEEGLKNLKEFVKNIEETRRWGRKKKEERRRKMNDNDNIDDDNDY
jgi:hypothetical protein